MNSDDAHADDQPLDYVNHKGPGALQGEVWLNVQTYQAQSLIRGRRGSEEKPAIIGLVGCAERLKVLWQAIRLDDPFADWWLIKVEESIGDARSRLHRLQAQIETLLASSDAFEVSSAQSSRPHRVSLQFANPYAFRAAQMLADYDRLMCSSLTARHLGIALPGDVAEQVRGSGRWLRRVFALPLGYHSLEVCRRDVLQGTARAEKARACMGEVPREVLCGEQLPSLRPVTFKVNSVSDTASEQEG